MIMSTKEENRNNEMAFKASKNCFSRPIGGDSFVVERFHAFDEMALFVKVNCCLQRKPSTATQRDCFPHLFKNTLLF